MMRRSGMSISPIEPGRKYGMHNVRLQLLHSHVHCKRIHMVLGHRLASRERTTQEGHIVLSMLIAQYMLPVLSWYVLGTLGPCTVPISSLQQ